MHITLYNPVNLSYLGGAEKWILEVAQRLTARGHEITVVTTGWSPSKPVETNVVHQDIKLVELRFLRLLRGFAFPSALDLNLLIREFNGSDSVYFYVYPPNELIAWVLRSKLRSPLIGGFHTFLAPDQFCIHNLYRPLFRKAISAFHALHVLNQHLANLMSNWGYLNNYFIPNGVDTGLFKLGNSMNSGTFNVLYTGRLTADKGTDCLLKTIHYVNKSLELRDITFNICGSGPLKNLVEKTANKYSNVNYLGFVPPESFSDVYSNSDLFFIPSKSEGMPLRLLEAQSSGLPVVGSRIPGITDVIECNSQGILLDVGDIKGFADAIKSYYDLFVSSSKEYRQLKCSIREKIVKKYDWDVTISNLEHMFKESVLEYNCNGRH